MVPIFAYGPGANEFTGIMENTEIAKKIMVILGLK
jgi:alkaline phosphatase